MNPRVLFVDDEPQVLDGLRRVLSPQRNRWDMYFAPSGDEAWDRLHASGADAVVSDVHMPGVSGLELLARMRNTEATGDIPVVIVTGSAERDMKRIALDLGASDLINKPVEVNELVARVRSALRLKDYQDAIKAHNLQLRQKVEARTRELAASRLDVIWRLAKLAEFRDTDTGNHVVRVGFYCQAVAESLNAGPDFTSMLFLTSPLHDIGKIAIPDAILRKPGRLDAREREIMKQHCVLGARILQQDHDGPVPSSISGLEVAELGPSGPNASNHLLAMAATIALTHHEHWDGQGYPQGLKGEDVPLPARLVAVADVFDALTSCRPYKPACTEVEALAIMREQAGRHFDPFVFSAFEKSMDSIRAVRARFTDQKDATP
jgi:putative two-component system response regulator